MRWALLAAVLAFPGWTASGSAQEIWPGDEWQRADPEESGLDPVPLAELVRRIRSDSIPDLHGLLIIRDGRLVLEEYFDGWGPDRLHTLQSVTKSVTSALIGIAIERGDIAGVDEKVIAFFPEWRGRLARDRRWSALRLVDLLTMRSGTDYHERGPDSPHFQLNRTAHGWDRFYLQRPMVRDPGTHWQYDSGGVILMSALLQRRTGLHADAYARRHLFEPLGIDTATWFRNRDGHPHTGGGIDLRPRDMARFGLLYLRGGRWDDRQVVPRDWVARSTRQHVAFDPPRGRSEGYGYLWWILPPDPAGDGAHHIYAAMGFRAQYIFVVPEHELVVVVTGGTRNGLDQRRPIDFLYSHILPAVHR